MNIGITCYPTVGGSGAVAAELGKALAARGHDVHFIASRLPFRLEGWSDRIGFHQVDPLSYALFEHPPQDLALAVKMAEVAREHALDILHVHYAIPHAVSAYLATQMLGAGAPRVVTTLHGTDITLLGQDRSFVAIVKFAIERSDAVTAVSEFLRATTQAELAPERAIAVVPNFVDVASYAAEVPPTMPTAQPDRERVLLHLSNFRPIKRVTDVVRIFARAAERVPALALWMAGEGPDRAAVEALARTLGVRDRVRFLGVTDSIRNLARRADVFLLPSQMESFGLASLEAMACGIPVVATGVGGTPEVVEHGVTGYLAQVGDIEAMAAHVGDLLGDERRRRAMGAAGRERALGCFDEALIVPRYERIYKALLAR